MYSELFLLRAHHQLSSPVLLGATSTPGHSSHLDFKKDGGQPGQTLGVLALPAKNELFTLIIVVEGGVVVLNLSVPERLTTGGFGTPPRKTRGLGPSPESF